MIKAYYSNTAVDVNEDIIRPMTSEFTWSRNEDKKNEIKLNWWPLIDHHPGSDLVMPENSV